MPNNIELQTEDFEEDKYSRLRLIPWWEQERLSNATIMVVGAGAIGNELIKNLALLGIGRIMIIDMDKIENTNLTRSVLYRAKDVGRFKAVVAAERAVEINPDIKAKAFTGNIIDDIGLGVFRRMDVVLGGLDNREARLSINQSCYKVNKPWIDGAIEVLNGFARVFVPPEGPCYECTMTETDWKLINKRKSCALLTHEQMIQGKIPTTPTSSAIIAGVQVQEMLKLLHRDRGLPTLAGQCYVFNGLTHDSYVVQYQRKPDCMSHDTYEAIEEKPWSVRSMTLDELVREVKAEMGIEAVVDLDRDIVTSAVCSCGEKKDLYSPLHKLRGPDITCNKCGKTMNFNSLHSLNGTEDFLDKTLFDIGIPPLHIVAGRNGRIMKYFEFSADATEVFADLWGESDHGEHVC
ncbi:HesA/MoeB/ThiF family protein [Diplocloster agilis]|uniref:HesA/MoeB/ThiF family protein n=1 Tax=Diplocloster agilis TaxID=2850323 RepID=UPI000821B862|nr:ThiF family adenylyltransferase [Suonthocola fibrivorans]MCU6735385.1 ThiF family adenylyltransferase [Suonthocola fibrivorans]SCJ72378.1 Probable adenylyltransferase/sulfurtransferase MoeZ [uncultured Clostridium sp.]